MQSAYRESLTYKGFTAHYAFIVPVGVYVAEVWHDDDVITFGATSLRDLVHVMQESIEHYQQYAKAREPIQIATT